MAHLVPNGEKWEKVIFIARFSKFIINIESTTYTGFFIFSAGFDSGSSRPNRLTISSKFV